MMWVLAYDGCLAVRGSTESLFVSLERPSDVLSLLDSRDGRYVAVLFENNSSYVGREVLCPCLSPSHHVL